jgi:hypothetical protein
MISLFILGILLIVIGFAALGTERFANGPTSQMAISSPSLVKTRSGLVAHDPLNESLTEAQLRTNSYWRFAGDAPAEGAVYNFSEDSDGLHIGVRAPDYPTSPSWAGYFAVSPNSNFVLMHANITAPEASVPSGIFESGEYLQTANGHVSYVTCTSYTSATGTVWMLVATTGSAISATEFKTLWTSSAGLPLTESCTIITNGSNYLKVYLDDKLVYFSNNASLEIPSPFQVYLEPESSYKGAELYCTFRDYYVTSGENLTIDNLPTNATSVALTDPSTNSDLASAPVFSGRAAIEMGGFALPLRAEIRVLDSSNKTLASSEGAVPIYAGDSYSYSTTKGVIRASSNNDDSSSRQSVLEGLVFTPLLVLEFKISNSMNSRCKNNRPNSAYPLSADRDALYN